MIGAGIAGCLLAVNLKKNGFESHVFEKISVPRDVGGSLCLNVNGFRALNAVDLAEKVRS